MLTSVPFNKNNINLYGTKILGFLFTRQELADGTVEPKKTNTNSLDQTRVDIIKGKNLYYILCNFIYFF